MSESRRTSWFCRRCGQYVEFGDTHKCVEAGAAPSAGEGRHPCGHTADEHSRMLLGQMAGACDWYYGRPAASPPPEPPGRALPEGEDPTSYLPQVERRPFAVTNPGEYGAALAMALRAEPPERSREQPKGYRPSHEVIWFEGRVQELEEALRGLLLSANALWEERNEGHGWPEAVLTARRLLERRASLTKGEPE